MSAPSLQPAPNAPDAGTPRPGLARARCLNHHEREAVARCPQCRQFFCRECVLEHDGRLICAGCLRKMTEPAAARRRVPLAGLLRTLWRAAQLVLGVFIAWMVFNQVGRILISIPPALHDPSLFIERELGADGA
jgi:hypothetical protein